MAKTFKLGVKYKKMNQYQLSASIICADLGNLTAQVKLLDKAGIDYIEVDVMDGIFVPRYGLPPEIIRQIRTTSSTPIIAHMMVQNPESYIEVFIEAGADMIIVHLEPLQHIHRVIKTIKDQGAKVGVAINPATPLSVLDYILDDIDLVMLMGINPGIVGHKLIKSTYKKIVDLKEKLSEYPNIKIQIDGGVNLESGPKMVKLGADILVCGTSTIFNPPQKVDQKTKEFRQIIDNYEK